MRIIIDINHPAHIHLFRNAASIWAENGDEVLFTATHKDVVRNLLEAYDLPHKLLGERKPGIVNLATELVRRTHMLTQIGRRFEPDVFLSVGSPTAAFASKLLGKRHIAFDDTEDSVGQARLYRPFTDVVCVPSAFGRNFGKQEVRYAGYHELAYLHPDRFSPDASQIAPLTPETTYFVVRFISWDAAHDSGESGVGNQSELVKLLLEHGLVVLSVEKSPPVLLDERGERAVELPAEAMHHYLAFAKMYIGEGVTAASEAAVLGRPSILINTRKMGYSLEQQDVYSLSYIYPNQAAAMDKIQKLVSQTHLHEVWRYRRERMLNEKIDVTAWMVDFVSNYMLGQA